MRKLLFAFALAAAGAVGSTGCHPHAPNHVDGGVLGRVVIYRNGVAFYERRAQVADGKLVVHVPRDKVDDFLKSLTVVDRKTNRRLSVTIPRKEATDGSYLAMTLETADRGAADVMVTYVTEAPAWKPSYRVVVKDGGKVMLEGWAVVDNTTSEDWKGVLVGVGASSAMAFRYDLWSVRHVDRDLLASEERFAVAPPESVSPYSDAPTEELAELDPTQIRPDAEPAKGEVISVRDTAPTIDPTSTKQGITIDKSYIKNVPVPGRTFDSALGAAAGSQSDGQGVSFSGSTTLENQYFVDGVNTTSTTYGSTGGSRPEPPKPPPPIKIGDEKLKASVDRILAAKKDVVIEVHGAPANAAQIAARGQAVKNQLVDDGIEATRIHVVPRIGNGEADRVRVLAVAPGAKLAESTAAPGAPRSGSDAPVGESHFFADRPMTVAAGSSAMVAMVHQETDGGVVYYYDPLSARGDQRFAFKAVRLDNPTKDTLEPGPVTVYGDDRFIGEGITEPVPPHASIVVPFAADKQVVVERHGSEEDRIAKLVTVSRGVMTAELQHRRTTTFKVTSRLAEPTTVYLRHRLEEGWTLVDDPPPFKRVGDSHLFEVTLGAGETREVAISEATPIERTFDLASSQTLGMMQLYIEEPDASPALKEQITALLVAHHEGVQLMEQIQTLREQQDEYRDRAAELHAQIVTLKAVKTSGELMATLKQKLIETTEHQQKATIAIVDAQEKVMLARVKFQNLIADLHLEDATKVKGGGAKVTAAK